MASISTATCTTSWAQCAACSWMRRTQASPVRHAGGPHMPEQRLEPGHTGGSDRLEDHHRHAGQATARPLPRSLPPPVALHHGNGSTFKRAHGVLDELITAWWPRDPVTVTVMW